MLGRAHTDAVQTQAQHSVPTTFFPPEPLAIAASSTSVIVPFQKHSTNVAGQWAPLGTGFFYSA